MTEARTAELLADRLAWWRTLKFGLMMHWGAYSQWGCIESWPLSQADTWARPEGWSGDMDQYRRDYWALNGTFNPTRFDPGAWADLAREAGMRYMVFTTKHHDGFNMYDTRLTDYKVTAADCPFHRHPQADVTAALFDAFRARGFAIGAYYSKADWHSPHYWIPDRPAPDRHPNYDTAAEPERWQKFKAFVHGQIAELMTRYGPVDILWLDAGQVQPAYKQDIDMDGLAAMARTHQPGLIVVDRTVKGPNENYLTPEQEIPDEPLFVPWESNLTMATQWSYKPDDAYKSTRTLIHMLIDIVAKGGNFLLNVGPTPTGELPMEAQVRLREIGRWLRVAGEAIYGSEVCEPYRTGDWGFTRRENSRYAFYFLPEGPARLPAQLVPPLGRLGGDAQIRLLGAPGVLAWSPGDVGPVVQVPESLQTAPPTDHAVVLRIDGGRGDGR